ncbi:MAG: 16S rRNA (guanine(966)-N(2))-methyltransferase RsmD [candidate division Zixibacteria bacterium]|nr:16S rRNA (guanine(966)-N(2))-methyltransferase RsmD [candidate division Zixibacteria bacterium]
MRIIAGKLKGRKLTGPKGNQFRPTLDRVKESIFNVLGEDIIGSRVLDLFCGSGSLGIEAISRGARRTTFVDSDNEVLEIARSNASSMGVEFESAFYPKDVFEYIQQLPMADFNIIMADPPYEKMYGTKLCEYIAKYNTLTNGGIFIIERFKKDKPETTGFKLVKKLEFGQTEVDFYIRED